MKTRREIKKILERIRGNDAFQDVDYERLSEGMATALAWVLGEDQELALFVESVDSPDGEEVPNDS